MLDVGPVATASAVIWIEWAHGIVRKLRLDPASRVALCADVLDDVGRYLEQWKPPACTIHGTFRWHAEIDPDELEYLVHAFVSLDARLVAEVERGEPSDAPDDGRVFYLVLVRALLHALEMESPGRAAFVDQLRSSWPSAAEAS